MVPENSTTNVVWPARTAGHNFKSKYMRYKGNAEFYQKDTMAKRSYYNEVSTSREPEPASKSGMTESAFGKYRSDPIMGTNGMENTLLPDFVKKQAHAYMSMSVATGTAAQYCLAINVIGPALDYLKRPIKLPLTTSDCIALIASMANVRNLKTSTITYYFSGFRMLKLIKGHYNQNLRADIVTQMIKGIKNGDQIRDMIQNTQHRQSVTVGIMVKLRESIHNAKIPLHHKILVYGNQMPSGLIPHKRRSTERAEYI